MGKTCSRKFLTRINRALDLARYYSTVERSGLFDAEYYLTHYDDVKRSGVNPLRHYLLHGGFEGRNPSPWFFSEFYLTENQDVYRRRINPLVHYIQRGDWEGRRPNPFFDPHWYRIKNQYSDSTTRTTLSHYVREGRSRDLQTCDPDDLKDLFNGGDAASTEADPLSSALATWRGGMPYSKWVERFDTLSSERVRALTQRSVPAYPTTTFFIIFFPKKLPLDALTASIQALRAQLYPNWRALIIQGGSFDERSVDELPTDPRCRIATWSEARTEVSIAAAGNKERLFCAVVQPGERLREHALLEFSRAIEGHKEVEVLYADEDTLLANGRRSSPIFKPDWDPLLFSHTNYVGSSTFVDMKRFSLLAAPPPTGSQTITEICTIDTTRVPRDKVVHLSSILLHTSPQNSYAAKLSNNPPLSLRDARTQAAKLYINANSNASAFQPLVSILIPTKKNRELLEVCVTSILKKTAYPHFEIVVIDNDANHETKTFLKTLRANPRCNILVQSGPFNYSALNNTAVQFSKGEIICLLNDDVQISCPDWLDTLVAFGIQPGVGAVGSLLLYPDGTIQHGGVVIGGNGLAAHAFVGASSPEQSYMRLASFPREVTALTAACLLIERSKYLSVGGLDSQDLKVNFNDVDLCLKLKAKGLANIILPIPGMIHHESKSRGHATASSESNKQLNHEAEVMHKRWGDTLRSDPLYNRNLSLKPSLYQLATTIESDLEVTPSAYMLDAEYVALGREPRLDIYRDESNEARAARASRISPPLRPSSSLPRGLSVIILNKDAPELIGPLVQQLSHQQPAFARDGVGFEVLIGDTGSTNPKTLELYNNLPSCAKVRRGMKYNFSACNNDLEANASFDTVLFLNNDIILPSDGTLLRTGFDRLHADSRVGILGGVLLYPNGRIQHMGCDFLTKASVWGLPYHVHVGELPGSVPIPEQATYPSVTGAFLMISRPLFQLCGGFDGNYTAECQDIALCLEAHRRGFSSICVNLGPVIHIENATRPKGEENFADRRRFLRKFGSYIQGAFS